MNVDNGRKQDTEALQLRFHSLLCGIGCALKINKILRNTGGLFIASYLLPEGSVVLT